MTAPLQALRWLAIAAALASTGPTRATVTVVADEPRAFGWRVGDVVQRHVTVHASAGLALDDASVPAVGRRGKALELRRLSHRVFAEAGGGQRHEFGFDYQVFVSPTAVRTLEMPPVLLRFRGRPRDEDARIDAWPLTVAPLVPAEVSPRRGLGDLRPDAAPPPIDTAALRHRLTAGAAAVALLLGSLFAIDVALPWLGRERRPFERAWRGLKRAPALRTVEQQRAALRLLHAALNQAAGQVLFAAGVERFVAAQPQYAAMRGELGVFFERSRQAFFAAEPSTPASAAPALAAAVAAGITAPVPAATAAATAATPATVSPTAALAIAPAKEKATAPRAATPGSQSADAARELATWLPGFARRLRDVERGSV